MNCSRRNASPRPRYYGAAVKTLCRPRTHEGLRASHENAVNNANTTHRRRCEYAIPGREVGCITAVNVPATSIGMKETSNAGGVMGAVMRGRGGGTPAKSSASSIVKIYTSRQHTESPKEPVHPAGQKLSRPAREFET